MITRLIFLDFIFLISDFFTISTSGNSENIIRAITAAKEKGVITIGFTGKDGGKIAEIVDISLCVSHPDTPRVQESHILIGHMICDLVEQELALGGDHV